MSCENNNGLYTEWDLRDLFVGDGRVWGIETVEDITGMIGRLAIKKSVNTSDADAMIIIDGELDTPAEDGKIYRIFFEMTDEQSATTLIPGGAHIGIRLKPLNGVTQQVVSQQVQIRHASPASMTGGE